MPDGPFSFSGNISGIMTTQQRKEEKKTAPPTCLALYITVVLLLIGALVLWSLTDLF